MKHLIFLFGIFLIVSCGNQSEKKYVPEISKIEIVSNVSGNYETIQSKNKQKALETLIVVIDPHGDGKLAVSEFQGMTENFDCTIIGLNDVKNNIPDFEEKIKNDINSVINKLNLKIKHLFIVGFSGGARMAFQYALSHKVDGVIMCGAGINMQKISELSFPLVMITGTKDFNFIEQYYSPYSPVVKNKNVLTLIFKGIHEWPDKNEINTGLSFLFRKNNIRLFERNDFSDQGKHYLKQKDYFKAFKMFEAAFKTNNIGAEQRLNNLLENENFHNFINKYEAGLQKEMNRNNAYIQDINNKDLKFWNNEISKINHFKKSNIIFEASSYARTKAYLGIAMYSFVNREIANPWSKTIDKYLNIYEMLEPENPDLWFFKSVRAKQKNNTALSKKYLKRAFVFGFKDSLKAENYGLIH